MRSPGDIVLPEDEPGVFHGGSKHPERPGGMADHGVKRFFGQQLAQTGTRLPDGPGRAHPHLSEVMHRHPHRAQFPFQPAEKADAKMLFERRTELAMPGQRDEQRLDAAVQIAGSQM